MEDKRTHSRCCFKIMYLPPPIPSDPWRHGDIFLIFNRPLKLIKIMSHHGSINIFKILLWCLTLVLELCGHYNLNAQSICCHKKSPLCGLDIELWLSNPCHSYIIGKFEVMGRTLGNMINEKNSSNFLGIPFVLEKIGFS